MRRHAQQFSAVLRALCADIESLDEASRWDLLRHSHPPQKGFTLLMDVESVAMQWRFQAHVTLRRLIELLDTYDATRFMRP
jgi:hypothetical protein